MPKTYEQLLKDQNAQTIKPPTVTIDFSHLEEVEVEDHRKDDDNHSTTSGVTEGPEALEDHDISDREVHDDIELFGNYEVVSKTSISCCNVSPNELSPRFDPVTWTWKESLLESSCRTCRRFYRV